MSNTILAILVGSTDLRDRYWLNFNFVSRIWCVYILYIYQNLNNYL